MRLKRYANEDNLRTKTKSANKTKAGEKVAHKFNKLLEGRVSEKYRCLTFIAKMNGHFPK